MPTPQSIQLLKLVAPGAAEDVPPAHWVHTELPSVVVNLPGTHIPHAPAPVAPVAAKDLPAAQSMHTELPIAVAYLPATHVIHAPAALAPVVAEDVPAAQSVHTEWNSVAIVNLPAAHVTHVVLEDALEIFPSSQNKHVLAPRAG